MFIIINNYASITPMLYAATERAVYLKDLRFRLASVSDISDTALARLIYIVISLVKPLGDIFQFCLMQIPHSAPRVHRLFLNLPCTLSHLSCCSHLVFNVIG